MNTLDDDLDQDGFGIAEDCDDNNANVNPNQEEVANNEIDDNCNGEIDETIIATNEIIDTPFELYPNPARDLIHFRSDFNIERVELIDIFGRILQSSIVKNNEVNINKLPVGTYIVGVHIAGRIHYVKMVKM